MRKMQGKVRRILAMCSALLLLLPFAGMEVQAATFYESDGQYHAEGYIFVGESHIVNMSTTIMDKTDTMGNVQGVDNIQYSLRWDWSQAVTEKGDANTFLMSGNLFFVFEGISGHDGTVQTSLDYIHSDGKGGRGKAVERIHEIIDKNPNIAHWTIIAFTGGAAAKNGAQAGRTHAQDYRNWIDYEFPYADVYVVSQTTMTKYYRGMKDPDAYNREIAAAVPEAYLDYMDFFRSRYPQGMLDPALIQDTVHWSHETLYEFFVDVIHQVERRRMEAPQEGEQQDQEILEVQTDTATQAYETVAVDKIMNTNAATQLYQERLAGTEIVIPVCEQGLPISVNGITTTGFYRVTLAENTYYIPAAGLSADIAGL